MVLEADRLLHPGNFAEDPYEGFGFLLGKDLARQASQNVLGSKIQQILV